MSLYGLKPGFAVIAYMARLFQRLGSYMNESQIRIKSNYHDDASKIAGFLGDSIKGTNSSMAEVIAAKISLKASSKLFVEVFTQLRV